MRIEKNCTSVIINKMLVKDLNYTSDLAIHFKTESLLITHSVRLNKEDACDIAREIIQHYSK